MPENKIKLSQAAVITAKLLFGSAVYAAGFSFFMYPNAIVSGGVTGIAMIINLWIKLPIGVLVIALNAPLFIIAWRRLGFGFLMLSLAGTVVSSVLVDVFSSFDIVVTSDLLLASIYGGLLMGAGLGLVYSSGATTGGVDVAAKLLRLKFAHINYGSMILALDFVVVVCFTAVFGRYDIGMYALLALFLVSKVIDLILYGAVSAKLCYVITEKSADIKTAITDKLGRSATLISGEGAFTGKSKDIILCVLKRTQIVELKSIVNSADSNAFMIVNDAREVFGNGFPTFF